jgi:hypothetical protein
MDIVSIWTVIIILFAIVAVLIACTVFMMWGLTYLSDAVDLLLKDRAKRRSDT